MAYRRAHARIGWIEISSLRRSRGQPASGRGFFSFCRPWRWRACATISYRSVLFGFSRLSKFHHFPKGSSRHGRCLIFPEELIEREALWLSEESWRGLVSASDFLCSVHRMPRRRPITSSGKAINVHASSRWRATHDREGSSGRAISDREGSSGKVIEGQGSSSIGAIVVRAASSIEAVDARAGAMSEGIASTGNTREEPDLLSGVLQLFPLKSARIESGGKSL